MATPKELFLNLLRPDAPSQRLLVQYEALEMVLSDPVGRYLAGDNPNQAVRKNRWGITMVRPDDAPGSMPLINEQTKVCPDVTRWRDFVHAPDIASHCTQGWEQCALEARARAGDERLVSGFMGTGIFEQCHFLMGFEDTLTNLYEHPGPMHELIDYITEYRLTYAKMLIDGLGPDLLFTHDDWGTKEALFMKPDMWREFFKEPYRRFYGYIRSRGVIAVHHGDSCLAPIVEDMAEIGIQVWQGVLPENDIPALQKRLGGRMVLMGGIGAAVDRPDAGEQEIRRYVRGVLESCAPGGHFIPCITYGLAGTVYPHVDPVIDAEIRAYNGELHLPGRQPAPAVRRRTARRAPEASPAQPQQPQQPPRAQEGGDTLQQLSTALRRGQKNRVLQLCRQALDEGTQARDVLTKGLVEGMSRLGEDFSANRVFVPEMLMAARCMNAATELLRPLLAQGAQTAAGRVCLGTVRGDLHDIGKNLVKIMMEGCGLEVIDLGVDVAPETFVQTAKEKACDIIACSSLLTTSMPEMQAVVELADRAGIHGRVKIMVGGAPVTQEFCDRIGADVYTDDAAQAARAAVELLRA